MSGSRPVPAEIAREVFRQLARMRRPPTPENYTRVYAQQAGLTMAQVQPAAAAMEALARGLLADAPRAEFSRELRQALEAGQWAQAQRAIRSALLRAGSADPAEPAHLPVPAHPPAHPAAPADPATPPVHRPEVLLELLTQALSALIDQRTGYPPEVAVEASLLADALRLAQTPEAFDEAAGRLAEFWPALAERADGPAPTLRALHDLARLMVRNMGDLVVDDDWVREQTAALQALLERPLGPEVLAQAAQSYREFVFRQGTVKHAVDGATRSVREQTASLVDRVGALSARTGEYPARIADYARQIREADGLPQLSGLLDALLAELEAMQAGFAQAQRELLETGEQMLRQEQQVRALQAELSRGELLPADPVTGSLNRQGFERQAALELARADRHEAPMCLAVLDVDSLRELDARVGAGASDEALRELALGARQTLRPTDTLARWSDQEFLILMPDTAPDEGERQMVRVQRELTKRLFLRHRERVLITFSAGVAARGPGESRESLVARAEQAMAAARQSGRNRVQRAPDPEPPADAGAPTPGASTPDASIPG
ncbi:MAG: GGDEF domain-containing protein [Betaproteobacteria bacterium]|nr:GGDEF domain-containing protein [Betaproteobacteria bacterium]